MNAKIINHSNSYSKNNLNAIFNFAGGGVFLILFFLFGCLKINAQNTFNNPDWQTIYNELYVNNSPSVIITGTWTVTLLNTTAATPNNAPREIIMAPGSKINITNKTSVNWRNLTIHGQNQMWEGINIPEESSWFIFNNNTISDAHRALNFSSSRKLGSNFGVSNNTFNLNNIGIYWKGNDASIARQLNHNTFNGGTLKQSYSGQPSKNSTLGIGVYLEDYQLLPIGAFVLGSAPNAVTTFNNLSYGIYVNKAIKYIRFKDLSFNNNTLGICIFDAGEGIYEINHNNFNNDVNGIILNSTAPNTSRKGGSCKILDNTITDCAGSGIAVSDFTSSEIYINTLNNINHPLINTSITCNRSNVKVHNNTLNRSQIGIQINYNSQQSTEVYSNTFNTSQFAIVTSECAPGLKFRIYSNNISNISERLQFSTGISIFENGILPFTNDNSIESNTIYSAQDSRDGIYMINASNTNIVGNNIYNQNSTNQSADYNGIGVNIVGGGNNYINSNAVINTYYNLAGDNFTISDYGYKIESSANNNFCCNTANKTKDGIAFYGACSNTLLRATNLLRNDVGLRIGEHSVIGAQVHFGNTFTQYTSPVGAVHEESDYQVVNLSQFTVHTQEGTQYHPYKQSVSSNWFYVEQGNPYQCGQTPCMVAPEIFGSNDSWTSLDNVTKNGWPSSMNGTASKWEGQRDLYRKLMRNPDWLNIADRLAFANAMSNTTVAAFQNIDQHWRNAYSNLPNTFTNLKSLNNQLSVALTTLNGYYTELDNGNNDPSLISNIESQNNVVVGLQTQIKDATVQNEDYLSNVADQIFVENNNITTTSNYELNQKSSNSVYFQTVAKGVMSLNTAQENLVLPIATQCVLEGGNGVALARSLYHLVNPTYKFNAGCSSNQGGGSSKLGKSNINIEVFPNPSIGVIMIKYERSNDPTVAKLTDISGKLLKVYNLDNQQSEAILDIQEYENGLYFISVERNGMESKIHKIVLLK